MKIAYKGFLKVLIKDVLLKSGKLVKREVVSSPSSVGMFCHNEDYTKFYFTKQFRIGTGQETIEIPAGRIDEGEHPRDSARREAREELGREVTDIRYIKSIYVSPGYTDEVIYLYDVTVNENFIGQELDTDEEVEVLELNDEDMKEILTGSHVDSKTLITLMNYFKGMP